MRGRDPFKMPGDWIFKLFPFFFVIVFIAIICYWIAVGIVGVKVFNTVKDCTPEVVQTEKDGVKSMSVQCKK